VFSKVFKFNPNHDEKGLFTSAPSGGGATIFASPNRHEGNQNIDTAAGRIKSNEQTALKGASRQIDSIVGMKGAVHDALGAWSDGAENSTVSQFTKGTYQQVLVAAAMRGYLGEQKAVIAFKPDKTGPSRMHVWETPSSDLNGLNKDLVRAGLEYHTLIPTDKGTRVMVWEDKGTAETMHRVRAAAAFMGGKLVSMYGHGQMLGSWDSREEGRKAYTRVIANWGKRNPSAYAKWKDLLGSWTFGANKGGLRLAQFGGAL
jgi:hypothetical protein